MNYFRRILPYMRPYWPLALGSALLTLVVVLVTLLEPWPLQILIDNVLSGHPLSPLLARVLAPLDGQRVGLLLFAVIGGLALRLLQSGLTVANSYVQTKLKQSMILDFRSDLFQHAQRLSLAYHDQRRAGGVIYAINFQADAAAGVIMTILPLVQSALTLLGMFWISFRIDRQLALIALTVVPVLYYSVGYYVKNIQTRLQEVKGMEGETISIIHEAMSMLRVIMAFGREDHEYQRFRDLGERARDARVQLTVRQTLFSLGVNMTTALGMALVLGFGAHAALQGRLSAGQLLVIMSYITAVYKPLEAISSTIGSLQDQFVSLQIAFDLKDMEPEICDSPGAQPLARAAGALVFDNVQFAYSRRSDTLQDVSFQVEPGQVVGIVGPTGAGKTTLASLIPRFYDPSAGRILLDGYDLRELRLHSLRDQISLVLQEPLLFSGTIAANIRYGKLDAPQDGVVAAAKAANAHDFIMRLPDQYQTQVGERGVKLSGGERQRLCIARAFLKDAPILILDEPTSAVDSRTEAVILEALNRLMMGRTTLMIAHRLSTIRNADIILVIDQGRLVQQGSHDELLAAGGLYKQMVEAQTRQAAQKNGAAPPKAVLEAVA